MSSFRLDRYIDSDKSLIKFGDPHLALMFRNSLMKITMKQVCQLLTEELARSELFSKTWKEAQKVFKVKKETLLNQGMPFIPTECHVAIIAYTLNTQVGTKILYHDFNEKCRNMSGPNSWDSFPYKSMYCLLMWSYSGVNSVPSNRVRTYRGVNVHYNLRSIREGQEVCFNQFTSSSSQPHVADFFKKGNGKKGAIIEFPEGAVVGIGIEDYSLYAESEVLIFPWNIFRISSITKKGDTQRIVLENVTRDTSDWGDHI